MLTHEQIAKMTCKEIDKAIGIRKERMRILSLGWGVQSFTLTAMAALGEIDPIDVAIHSDTTHERQSTYAFSKKWTPWLVERGVNVVTVKPEYAETVNRFGGVMLPAFTRSDTGGGMLRRQCTDDWKRKPMRQYLQTIRDGQVVELLMGISLDEVQRMRESDVKYIVNSYPLIDLRMTRAACVQWLQSHGLGVPTKSACVFCPFQSRREWRQVKDNKLDWHKAVEVDEFIRKKRPTDDGGLLFVHPDMKPLTEVDMQTPEEKGQLSLWENECYGLCGV